MEIYGISDKGMKRSTNEDSFVISARGKYAIVADGMGGHLGGEVASSMCTDRLSKFLDMHYSKPFNNNIDPEEYFKSEVIQINKEINKRARESIELTGMGTTLSFLMEFNSRIVYINVGDSRIYLVRESKITQLTEDDSVVNDLFKKGKITLEEKRFHPLKNIITKAVGTNAELIVNQYYTDFLKSDYFVMSTDGLNDMVEDDEILKAILDYKRPKRICEKLVSKANLYGGRDNITVVVCKV
jgi:serine/threonine protein phosphatase PrpC